MSLRIRGHQLRQLICILGVVAIAIAIPGNSRAQAPAPVPVRKQATLWSFLGIPQTYTAVKDNLANRNGNRPNAERKPNLTRLADPANLESPNPAIKRAAEIKKEEDLKKQKIKAVKYLTKIGCGCYNRDGSITDALLKALDDCTEDVRYETVKAITEAANGEACENCKNKSCCSEELSNKLYEMAYERDDSGCFLEPSERVRQAAAEALRACCPGRGSEEGFIIDETDGAVGPGGEVPQGERPDVIIPGTGERPGVPPPSPPRPAVPPPSPPPAVPPVPGPELGPVPAQPGPNSPPTLGDETGSLPPPGQRSSRRTAGLYQPGPSIRQASSSTDAATSGSVTFAAEQISAAAAPPSSAMINDQPPHHTVAPPARPAMTAEPIPAMIAGSIDTRNNQAMVNLPGGEIIRVGTLLRGYHTYAFTGRQPIGEFVVVQSTAGFAIVRPHGQTRLNKLTSGDQLQPVH